MEDGVEPEEKRTSLRLTLSPRSIGEVGSLGELALRNLSVGALRELSKADLDASLPVADLISALLATLVVRLDGEILRPEVVAQLTVTERERLVAEIIARNPDWLDAGERGVPREIGEDDEHHLARAYRHQAERFATSMRDTAASLASSLGGMGERMRALLAPGLAANSAASSRVADLVGSMDASRVTFAPIGPSRLPKITIPPNPVHETNEILGEVAGHIAQMRELAVATADMQRSLNDTATAAVADFARGAEASAQSSEQALELAKSSLWMAKVGLAVAVVTALLTLAAIVATLRQSQGQDAEITASKAQEQRLSTALARSQTQLNQTIEELHQKLAKRPPVVTAPVQEKRPRSTRVRRVPRPTSSLSSIVRPFRGGRV